MTGKMTCPGCGARLSSVLNAYAFGDPCPSCGLPASAAEEVLSARRRGADADLTARYERLVVRVGAAEATAERYRMIMEDLRDLLRRFDDGAGS